MEIKIEGKFEDLTWHCNCGKEVSVEKIMYYKKGGEIKYRSLIAAHVHEASAERDMPRMRMNCPDRNCDNFQIFVDRVTPIREGKKIVGAILEGHCDGICEKRVFQGFPVERPVV